MPDDKPVPPSREAIRARIKRVKSGIRITKITTTRSIKSRNGDTFCGFSAAWQSVQDDHGGMGADAHSEPADDAAAAAQGLSLSDARLARLLLSMECDVAALESAMANGGISANYYADAVRAVRSNYHQLIQQEMGVTPNDDNKR
jgi:hypothetical protein